jgi:hypothetical protein
MHKWTELKRSTDFAFACCATDLQTTSHRWFIRELPGYCELPLTWRGRCVPGENDGVRSGYYSDRNRASRSLSRTIGSTSQCWLMYCKSFGGS